MMLLRISPSQSKLAQFYDLGKHNETLLIILERFRRLLEIDPVSLDIPEEEEPYYEPDSRKIFIPDGLPDIDKVIGLAHELSHAFCDDNQITDFNTPIQKIEILCDYIAGWLMGKINYPLPYQLTSTFYYMRGYWGDLEHPHGHCRMQQFLRGYFRGLP